MKIHPSCSPGRSIHSLLRGRVYYGQITKCWKLPATATARKRREKRKSTSPVSHKLFFPLRMVSSIKHSMWERGEIACLCWEVTSALLRVRYESNRICILYPLFRTFLWRTKNHNHCTIISKRWGAMTMVCCCLCQFVNMQKDNSV